MTREQTIKEIRNAITNTRGYLNTNVCGYVNINGIHLTFLDWNNKPVLFFNFDKDTLYIWNGSHDDYRAAIIFSIRYENITEIF